MAKQKIIIITFGELHSDPGSSATLTSVISQLSKQNIPTVFCDEDGADQSIEYRNYGNQQIIQLNEILIKKYNVQQLLTTSKSGRKYFDGESFNKLYTMVAKNIHGRTSGEIEELVHQIFRYAAALESLKLGETIKKLNIPYVGVELTIEERQKISLQIGNEGFGFYQKIEQFRIDTMVKNILTKAIPMLKEQSGVIVWYGGANHVHRIGANLLQIIQSNDEYSNYEIEIITIKLFSRYVSPKKINAVKDTEEETSKNDSKEIIKLYSLLECKQIICEEDEKTGKFNSPEIDQIINSTIEKIREHNIESFNVEKTLQSWCKGLDKNRGSYEKAYKSI